MAVNSNSVLWYIDELMKDTNSLVKIVLPYGRVTDSAGMTAFEETTGETATSRRTIRCFLSDAVEMTTQASYSNASEVVSDIIGEITQAIGGGGFMTRLLKRAKRMLPVDPTSVVNAISGVGKLGGVGEFIPGTIKVWKGSQHTIPPIPLTFVATSPTQNVLNDVKSLLSMNMPGVNMFESEQGDTLDNLVFFSPNKYSPIQVIKEAWNSSSLGYQNNVEGTCRLEIGSWFHAGGLVPVSANFSISNLTTRMGYPLYATGTVTFETHKDLRAKDYLSLFTK